MNRVTRGLAAVPRERLSEFLAGLPKAELHLHIEGSLEPEQMFSMAVRNGVDLPFPDIDSLRRAYAFTDLQSFLDIYYAGANVLRTEQDFYEMTAAYLKRAADDRVLHAEIMFDPQTHTSRGVAFETVLNGLQRACDEARVQYGLTTSLIMSFLRHLSEEEAFFTLERAMPYRDQIQSIGLDSSELGHPPSKFKRVYDRCRQLGFRLTAHAGEEGPPAYIREALDILKVERIDHGVQCSRDTELVARLARDRIALTVCPLSNLKLCVVPDLRHHNLRLLLEAGLAVTVNSDDPAYFGGYIGENFSQTAEALGLHAGHIAELARNSFEASFLDAGQRARHVEVLDAYLDAWQ